MMVARRAGLGSTWKLDNSGNWVDCDLWSNIFVGACWDPTQPTLAGPNASNPTTPVNPTQALLLGSTAASGQQLTYWDYLTAYLGNPSNVLWLGLVVLGGILLIRKL